MNLVGTYTGKLIDPSRLQMKDVVIIDIAQTLSTQCRFNGAVMKRYTNAEHAVHISNAVNQDDNKMCIAALMLNAPSAYLGDLLSPIKDGLKQYRETESLVAMSIGQALGYNPTYLNTEVKTINRGMTRKEIVSLTNFPKEGWEHLPLLQNLPEIQHWSDAESKEMFLQRFDELTSTLL